LSGCWWGLCGMFGLWLCLLGLLWGLGRGLLGVLVGCFGWIEGLGGEGWRAVGREGRGLRRVVWFEKQAWCWML
jgi:hypothetical protein